MFCPSCSTQSIEGAKFCKSCGMNLTIITQAISGSVVVRSEEHTSELQSQLNLVCRLLLEKKEKRPIPSSQLRPQTSTAETRRRLLRSQPLTTTRRPSELPRNHRRCCLNIPTASADGCIGG